MNVLLDSNIFIQDITLGKPDFTALRSYSHRTSGSLLMPTVVQKEVEKCAKQSTIKSYSQFQSTVPVLLEMLTKVPSAGDVEAKLLKHIDTKLNKMSRVTLDFNHVALEDLFNRSLEERPPFLSSDKGMRDSLIWLTLLEYLKENSSENVAFISNNGGDFGTKGILKAELQKELEDLNLADRFFYFNDLASFLSEYEKPIAFIDDEFIANAISPYVAQHGDDQKTSLDIDVRRNGVQYTVDSIDFDSFSIENFYVYDATKEDYIIFVEAYVQYYASLSYEDWDYEYDPQTEWMEPVQVTDNDIVGAGRTADLFVRVNKRSKKVTDVSDDYQKQQVS